MTNIRVLLKKISKIEKYFQMVIKYRQFNKNEIEKNEERYGALQRYVYLLCQATIDLAEAVISHYFYRLPGNYGEIFTILRENDLIGQDLEKKMIKMTGFRNVLAHAYGELDFEKFYEVIIKDIDDIKIFLKAVKEKLNI